MKLRFGVRIEAGEGEGAQLGDDQYQAAETGVSGLPAFVVRELEAFLACGLLCRGFLCAVCEGCGDNVFIAFSRQTRGLCPSYTLRRSRPRRVHSAKGLVSSLGRDAAAPWDRTPTVGVGPSPSWKTSRQALGAAHLRFATVRSTLHESVRRREPHPSERPPTLAKAIRRMQITSATVFTPERIAGQRPPVDGTARLELCAFESPEGPVSPKVAGGLARARTHAF